MKKIFSLFLALILFISIAVPVFADEVEPSSDAPIISSAECNLPMTISNRLTEEELRAMYWASSDFQTIYENNPDYALACLDKAVKDYFVSFPVSTDSTASYSDENVKSVYAFLVQQLNSYSCGPASTYMAIDGWNGTGRITGSTTTDKLEYLASKMGTNSKDGTIVDTLKRTINNYTDRYDYAWYLGSTLDEYLFRIYSFNSLAYKRAPILHAKTGALSYYNGHNTGHYITMTEFDYNTMSVRLNDPNNNNYYYGVHQVPYEEAHSSVADYPNRYMICYWS